MPLILGAIADDFTGATDLANTLVKEGMRTVQTSGVPGENLELDADAVVIALKSRTVPAKEAVEESLAALRWLQSRDVKQVFFKYCSTFDSTDDGNIGPVADALLDALGAPLTIICPAFPTNGRTIYKGHLFVGGQLLAESPMKDHPLTPMRDSDLVRVLGRQTSYGVDLVPHEEVARGAGAIRACLESLRKKGIRHAVVDAIDDGDLRAIGEAVNDMKLVTGGSGIALGLPDNFRRAGFLKSGKASSFSVPDGRAAVLAGSCSVATRRQLAHVSGLWPCFAVDPVALAEGQPVVKEALAWALRQPDNIPVVIHSSKEPEEVARVQERLGRERAGELVETAMSEAARGLVENGARRIVVAGGETSGAVVTGLGVRALTIGPEIEPGVPWTVTCGEPPVALALKSGNFGGEGFFVKALEMLA